MRELTEADKETIYYSLVHMGVVGWNRSCIRMQYALEYVVQHENLTDMQVIPMYVDIAKMDHCKWKAVERSLRYTINSIWEKQGLECSMLLYHSGTQVKRPSNSNFLYQYKEEYKKGNIQRWNDSVATPILSGFQANEINRKT